MKKKISAIERLMNENWFNDEKEAAAWIMERKVLVGGRPVLSPGEAVSPEEPIRLRTPYKRKYVSKGGLKLEGALETLGIDASGKVALDCGASTGGFTDCLLQKGAQKVYAVDAGFGQLAGKLRADPRVVNLERTNLADPRLRELVPGPELITLDLSYLSLKKAIPICADMLGEAGMAVCLVKPLFEVEDPEIRRSGELTEPELLCGILMGLYDFCEGRDYKVCGITHSPVTGNEGTLEYFIALTPDNKAKALNREAALKEAERAVEASQALIHFKKQ